MVAEIAGLPKPLVISAQVPYTNFDLHNHRNPVWLSIIDEPIKRLFNRECYCNYN